MGMTLIWRYLNFFIQWFSVPTLAEIRPVVQERMVMIADKKKKTDIWRITGDHKSLLEPLVQVNLKSKQYYNWIELYANQWFYRPNQKWCNVFHFRWSEMIGSNSFIS